MVRRTLFAAAVLLAACDADPTAPSTLVDAVEIVAPAMRLVPHQSVRLEASVLDRYGRPLIGRKVVWASDAPSVATISGAGVLTTFTPGIARITATVDGRVARARFEVIAATIGKLVIRRTGLSLVVHRSARLAVDAFDLQSEPVFEIGVEWSTTNPGIATISPDGTITGVASGLTTVIAAIGSVRDEMELFVESSPLPEPLFGPQQIHVPTYDGSGQLTHPDVLHFPAGWRGWEYWMAYTPYPYGNSKFENPSIVVSHDGRTWVEPPGIKNPVVPNVSGGYNSDPDLIYDAVDDRLVLIYREVSDGFNLIRSTVSANGIQWSPPVLVFMTRNHGAVAPSISLTSGPRPTIWYVDAGGIGCSALGTSVMMRVGDNRGALTPSAPGAGWSTPTVAQLDQPGYVVWHMDVIWVPSKQEYWAVFVAFRSGQTCGDDELFFARSTNGLNWTTYAVPFLRNETTTWASASFYRSTTVYDASSDVMTVWLSGRARDGRWHAGRVDYRYEEFIRALDAAGARATVVASRD